MAPHKRVVKEPDRTLVPGRPDFDRCDNKVVSARFTVANFIPKSIYEQFRRFANLYFLGVGIIMFVGTYTPLFTSAISPWSTLGPLAIVVMISMLVEGSSDYKRHLNDAQVNNTDCVVLQRRPRLGEQGGHDTMMTGPPGERKKNKKTDPQSSMTTMAATTTIRRDQSIMNGRDVLVNVNKAYYANAGSTVRGSRSRTMTDPNDPSAEMAEISFSLIPRKDIRQGMIVLVKNREMVPADIILLASSNDKGGAYIETSSIDGETNLKLRNSPHLPKEILSSLREQLDFDGGEDDDATTATATTEQAGVGGQQQQQRQLKQEFETLEAAVKRLTRFSALGRPEGTSALEHDDMATETHHNNEETIAHNEGSKVGSSLFKKRRNKRYVDEGKYVAALTTEPPNASVHTFTGKLTLPPFGEGSCQTIPLGAENILLRGAVIRNTEWVLGVAAFTGAETKLVKNSFATPSKFSQLDRLMNKTVMTILLLMIVIISWLATTSVMENDRRFNELVYIGYNSNSTEKWPYFTGSSAASLKAPDWIAKSKVNNWLQFFLQFITLISNMIPLSLYVTIEMIQFIMVWFINNDADMYDDTTDTRAQARSTIVSDLGRIQYIFSDKTGTLTQNVMRFKRCSVDGLAFGAPIPRMRVRNENDDNDEVLSSFHPVRQLLVGRFTGASRPPGLEGLTGEATSEFSLVSDDRLTFHAEMFLRVMSLCHTVVVEKDIENKDQIGSGMSEASTPGPRRTKSYSRTSSGFVDQLSPVSEGKEDCDSMPSQRSRADTLESAARSNNDEKGPGGAPVGYAYQAESPDEGALVSMASSLGFQVLSRDRNGILLRTPAPSHLEDDRVIAGLKSKSLSLGRIAAESAHHIQRGDDPTSPTTMPQHNVFSSRELRDEIWEIMAVNKFDSDRKRMSILLRSPENLGGIPILFCKGADSAMLDPEVSNNEGIMKGGGDSINMTLSFDLPPVQEKHEEVDEVGFSLATSLGLQMHLGEFAREGLRTLVLAMKILTEEECISWLETYYAAATSLKDRDKLLTAAAKEIERDLHIVGATAIEDKLQVKVPETIATLEQAGIKLWVLTGDKRETAVEIGYSTNVLTSKMCLTEVPDNGKQHVRAQMAMEFIRLTKLGHLPKYQLKTLHSSGTGVRESLRQRLNRLVLEVAFVLGKQQRKFQRNTMRIVAVLLAKIGKKDRAEDYRFAVGELLAEEKTIIRGVERRRKVRAKAEKTIRNWKAEISKDRGATGSGHSISNDDDDLSLTSEELPVVFNRASSAKMLLNEIKAGGDLSKTDLRDISLAVLTTQQAESTQQLQPHHHHHHGFLDEDALSMESFAPETSGDLRGIFDRRKRTILEKMFAVDRQVRKGRLAKHTIAEKLAAIKEDSLRALQPDVQRNPTHSVDAPRALVIEGAALKHLLGDPDFEDILFAVANCCNAVIACRVSPKQKAELVNLVRKKVEPEPITLAIGDGANDVGMIQEAHVGIGISGKEGTQAVNASDFAIAQFRFLETLVLIHGRWNFFRLSTVVLFSFYKNAVMCGIIVYFAGRTLYSGTPMFDEWVVAMLNFVAAAPILVLGTFDRCLSKEYVRANPQVYRSTRENELMNIRTMMRWIVLTLFHVYLLFGLTVPQQSYGGGITPGFNGLMRNASPDTPGDGEGGDLKSVGTVTFICMIILFAYKVMYESRSILHGKWPAPMCRDGEGFLSRLAYSWVGMTYLSIGFFLWSITIYSLVGYKGASNFSDYVDVAMHVMGTRSLSWILILFVPIMGMVFDVILKVFSNMYYPTQTQIHVEIEAMQKRDRKRALRQERRQAPRQAQPNPQQQQANAKQREDRTLQRRGLSSLDVSRISNDRDASRISDDNKNNNSKGGGDHDDERDISRYSDELEV